MNKKIRYQFVNPIKECLYSQGRRYTMVLLGVLVSAFILTVAAFALKVSPFNWLALGITIFYIVFLEGHFGINKVYPESEEN